MTARTDQHSPKNLVTEDYEYVVAFDNGAPGFLVNVDMNWWRSITNWPKATRNRSIHQCHHCGARIRYFAILKHVPTGEHIAVGEICLENRFDRASSDFHALRQAAALDRAKQRIKTDARDFVDGLRGDVKLALDRDNDFLATFPFIIEGSYTHSTINDIRRQLWNLYGAATDRQVAFVAKLIGEARDKADRDARIAAERAAETRIDAPVGRITFEGVVVSRKWYDSDYGGAYKLVVKVDDPSLGGVYAVFVTEPSKITTERGDIVRITATLARSDRDRSFAFGRRPSKASVIGKFDDIANLPDSLA